MRLRTEPTPPISTDWSSAVAPLRRPDCQGAGAIQIVAEDDFWDEDSLPFELLGGDDILHIVPAPGFGKANLAGSPDDRLLMVDCPDDEGWLVPSTIVENWMNRHVACEALEDLLLSHPLYEYLTRPDDEGRSRGGPRGHLLHWIAGVPTVVSLHAPEFLPGDPEAPLINTDRDAYADGVQDLLSTLEETFDILEVELGLRFGAEPIAWDDDDLEL